MTEIENNLKQAGFEVPHSGWVGVRLGWVEVGLGLGCGWVVVGLGLSWCWVGVELWFGLEFFEKFKHWELGGGWVGYYGPL